MYKQNNNINEKDKKTKKSYLYRVNYDYFESESAAKWSFVFALLGIDFEYKPGKIRLKSGKYFEPDFILHHLVGRVEGAIYASICSNDEDYYEMVDEFVGEKDGVIDRPLLILTKAIPYASCIKQIDNFMIYFGYSGVTTDMNHKIYPFNFKTIDGDYYGAFLGVNKDGEPELFEDNSECLENRDNGQTYVAYESARNLYVPKLERRN